MAKTKILLAFSGGLDTSFCVKYFISEKNYEVHTITVNTGGFTQKELDEIEKKALEIGAKTHKTIDGKDFFYEKSIKYLVFGNVLKNNAYPLSVSAERVTQAYLIAKEVLAGEFDIVAHGSTGAGNDQIRFDLMFQVLCPNVQIETPIRELSLSRNEEISFLQKNGVDGDWTKSKYSINQGLWGTSIGGDETLTSDKKLPEHAYLHQCGEEKPTNITLSFDKGELNAIDGKKGDHVELIEKLNDLGNKYAIGRNMHVGDTIIGIKGRIGFSAPAAEMIIKSHHLLEKHTLTKWQLYWKEQLGNWYGMMLHEALYLDPVMRNIETFLQQSQETVSGDVYLTLYPFRFTTDGIKSSNDLMNSDFGEYGETNKLWGAEDAKGFIKILSNPIKLSQWKK